MVYVTGLVFPVTLTPCRKKTKIKAIALCVQRSSIFVSRRKQEYTFNKLSGQFSVSSTGGFSIAKLFSLLLLMLLLFFNELFSLVVIIIMVFCMKLDVCVGGQ